MIGAGLIPAVRVFRAVDEREHGIGLRERRVEFDRALERVSALAH